MEIEKIKHLITWILLVSIILIILGSICEIKTCNGQLLRGMFWWECIKDE